MANEYLVEIDSQDREHEAILRLFKIPLMSQYLFPNLGIDPARSWYLLEIREHRLNNITRGEIDILAGRIEIESDQIDWVRSTNYIIAIEAKLAYLDFYDNKLKSQKSSPQKMSQIQAKIDDLFESGFDKVALLDMIANPPTIGQDGQAWLEALDRAFDSIDQMSVLKNRLPPSSPAGHWVWSIGSVIGGDEIRRGAGAPFSINKALSNPLLEKDPATQKRRVMMQETLSKLLSKLPVRKMLPLVFLDCRKCDQIHDIYHDCTVE